MNHDTAPTMPSMPRPEAATFPWEMLAYVGIFATGVGYFLLVGAGLLESGALAAVLVGVLGVVYLGAGWMNKSSDHPSSDRVTDVLWFASVFIVASAITSLMGSVLGGTPEVAAVLSGILGTIYAAVLWWGRKRTLLLLALFLSVVGLVVTLLALVPAQRFPLPLLGAWAASLAWMWLGMREIVTPRRPAIVMGAAVAVFAPAGFGVPMSPMGMIMGPSDANVWLSIVFGLATVVFLFFLGAKESHTGVIGLAVIGILPYLGILIGEIGTSAVVGAIFLLVGVVLYAWVALGVMGGGRPSAPPVTAPQAPPPTPPPEP